MRLLAARIALLAQRLGVSAELLARAYDESGKSARSILISAAAKRRYEDPAARAQLIEQGRRAAADPIVRDKKSAAMKAARADPAKATGWIERVRAAKQTPESRARTSKALKAAWERRRAAQAGSRGDAETRKATESVVKLRPRLPSGPRKPVRDARSEADMIAEAVAAGRVTRCPTAAVGATTARIEIDDRQALAAHQDSLVQAWRQKNVRRLCPAARAKVANG